MKTSGHIITIVRLASSMAFRAGPTFVKSVTPFALLVVAPAGYNFTALTNPVSCALRISS